MRSCTSCRRGKAISITYSECVCLQICLFSMQSACAVLRILSSVAYLALPHFFTLSHKRNDFRKTLLNIKYVLIFLTFCVCNFSHYV